MIANLKPYPAYKDSGVPWLGEVPEHWAVFPPKRVLQSRSSGTAPIKNTASAEPKNGYVPAFSASGQDVWLSTPTFRGPGLVLSAVGARCGKTFRADGAWAIVANTHVLLVREGHLRDYWWYVTNDEGWWERAGAAQPFVQVSKTLDRPWTIPPPPEQSAIVRFLDHVDRRVRRYIRAKQKLIKLLEEQKQAIIHRAVTRGLDSNVRLKPSGVEWLGDIPEHWGIRRNGRLFAQRNESGFADLPVLEVSLKTGIRIRNFDNLDRKQVMSDRGKYKRAVKGDIAYNMMRMWQGAVGVAPVEGLVSPAYVVAKPLHGTEPRYFSNLFRIAAYMHEIDKCSRGIVKDRNRLYWEDFKQMVSACPPPDEQTLIADAIDQRTQTVNYAIDRAQQEIELLREYRTRLIADMVTGELDVREAAARLPDEAEEPESLEEADALRDADEDAADDLNAVPEETEDVTQ